MTRRHIRYACTYESLTLALTVGWAGEHTVRINTPEICTCVAYRGDGDDDDNDDDDKMFAVKLM